MCIRDRNQTGRARARAATRAEMMSGSHLSKDFFDLVKAIGESKSKQQEANIIVEEVATLKKRMPEANVSKKKMKEFLIRLVYVEMLGHDASFGHIHAVNMTQQTTLQSKRVGYLASAVCLHAGHELTTLLVNTQRRDLKSSNYIEVCASLIAIPKLVNEEVLPALLPAVVALLEHPQEVVRKKAVMCLHRFYQVQPACVADLGDTLRRVLCDKDPAVMGASLYLLHDMAEANVASHKDLVPSFVSILKQITEHRLPSSFDYHRVPAPWIQIKLLKLLATLGTADQRASEGMYEVRESRRAPLALDADAQELQRAHDDADEAHTTLPLPLFVRSTGSAPNASHGALRAATHSTHGDYGSRPAPQAPPLRS